MGAYNILIAEIECPRCGLTAERKIDLYFGYRSEMLEFKLGEKYIWHFGKEVQNGGRPENGNIDGEGYVECGFCKKDFFVKVAVRNNVIKDIEIDLTKKHYIED